MRQITLPKACKKRTFNRELIHPSCIKICEKLHKNGFDAWLVGGCIRDLLLGETPKDFDITTVATPLQIKEIFKRQCRIIGKRFQIVHIYIGRNEDPIEVSTLRTMKNSSANDDDHIINKQGRIERDNIFGTSLKEDAMRRDFTINAIYYHPISDQCIDYTSGIEDVKKKILRIIGEPERRFAEDPLRIIRAARFRAKAGLQIDPQATAAMLKSSHKLQTIPAARMLDESRKLFLKGHALSSYQKLREYNLLYTLLPNTDKALNHNQDKAFADKYDQFIEKALINTDIRIKQAKPVSIPFLFATFLWVDVQNQHTKDSMRTKKTSSKKTPINPKVTLYREVCFQQRQSIRLSKFWINQIVDIWLTHERLIQHIVKQGSDKQAQRLLNREKFRAAYDFLCLRVESGEAPEYQDAMQWWTNRQL